jgi:uncharacterized membrane protein
MKFGEPNISRLIVVTALVLTACGGSMHEIRDSDFPSPANYKISELTYSSVYQRVLRPNCVGCHGNGNSNGTTLENYGDVKANLKQIYQTTVAQRKMPKAPMRPLTSDQLGILNAWIKADAPETAQDKEAPIPLGPMFDSIKYNILETKCLQCHVPGKSAAQIPLVTKDDLLNSPHELVIPGNPDESGIMVAIRGLNPKKLMPPPRDAQGKPTGFTKLSDQEIDAFAVWILNGAKD